MIGLFDTHAHYDDAKFDPDRDELLGEIRGCGVDYIVDVGCSFDSVPKAAALAEKYDFIFCTAGFHPNDAQAAEDDPNSLEFLRRYLVHPKNVALGEIGLDYYWQDVSRDIQKKWFEKQLELAEEMSKPVIIHDRDAHGDCMDIIRRHPNIKGVFHSYSGSPEMAEELIKRGWYISFSGVLTFKNAAKLPEVAKIVPEDKMLIETDCPYLAPVPHRGKRNNSSLMAHTADKLAEIRGISVEDVRRITTENAIRFYNLGNKIK